VLTPGCTAIIRGAWRATRDRRSLRSGHPASGPDASQPAFVAFDPLRLPIRRSALPWPAPT
jgi:hypothetical protein